MKKLLNSKIFIFILGVLITVGIEYGVYAINASEITYGNTTVEGALNTLYGKAHLSSTQVATLTTQGASYTMQNDGYVIGTSAGDGTRVAELHISTGEMYILSTSLTLVRDVSIYVEKGSVITTRTDGGVYNLTVYEWK